jgi:hypothetical protein
MAVETEVFLHFPIKYDTPQEVMDVLEYLFSNGMQDDEKAYFDNKLDPSDPLFVEKSEEFIKNNLFQPKIDHKFFSTNTEHYRYNWRAVAGWFCRDINKKKSFHKYRVFYLGTNRLYNNQMNDFLDWILPYIDIDETDEKLCIGWIKHEDAEIPKLLIVYQSLQQEIVIEENE